MQLACCVLTHPLAVTLADWRRLASTTLMQVLHLQHWQIIAFIFQLKEVL